MILTCAVQKIILPVDWMRKITVKRTFILIKKNGACKTLQTGHNIIHFQTQVFFNIKIFSLNTNIGLQNTDIVYMLHMVLLIGILFYIACS